MEFFDVVAKRRSIRKFTDQPVEKEKIDHIIDAAMRAPSARNSRSTELIVVSDPQTLSQLSIAKPAGAAFIKDAQAAIVVLADSGKSGPCIENAAITAAYIQLAATALGFGTCWSHMRGNTHNEHQSSNDYILQLLKAPSHLEVVCVIAIGGPDEEKAPYGRDELPAHQIHQGTY
jgi:nitroreductase